MKNQAIIEAVAQYREASFKKWLRITSIVTICVGSLIIAAHGVQCARYILLTREAARTHRESITLNKAVGDHLKEAKRLKIAKHLLAILTPNDTIPTIFTNISKTIPAHTILTTLRYQPDLLTLEGYAPDAQELSTFTAALNSVGFTDCKLQDSRDEAAGLKFILSSGLPEPAVCL